MALPDLNFTEADFKQTDAALVKRLIKDEKTGSKEQALIWVQAARAKHALDKAIEAKKAAKALERAAKIAQEKLDAEKTKGEAHARLLIAGELVLEEAKTSENMRGFLLDRLKGKEALFKELFALGKP